MGKTEEIVEMEIIIMEIIMEDIQITTVAIQTMEDIPITMVDTPATMGDIPTTTADTQLDLHIDQIIMAAILVTEMEDFQTIMVGIQVMAMADILAMVMEATQTMDTLETVSGLQEVIKSKMSLLRSEHDIVMIILMLINEKYKL